MPGIVRRSGNGGFRKKSGMIRSPLCGPRTFQVSNFRISHRVPARKISNVVITFFGRYRVSCWMSSIRNLTI